MRSFSWITPCMSQIQRSPNAMNGREFGSIKALIIYLLYLLLRNFGRSSPRNHRTKIDHKKRTKTPKSNEPSTNISEGLRRIRFSSYSDLTSDGAASTRATAKYKIAESPPSSRPMKEPIRPKNGERGLRRLQIDENTRCDQQVDNRQPSRSRFHPGGFGLPRVGERSRLHISGDSRLSQHPLNMSTQQWGPDGRLPQVDNRYEAPMPGVDGTIFRSAYDVEMASKQTRIETMNPEEREKQEEWAQSQIALNGVCPQNYLWDRIAGGYRCRGPLGTGGDHYATDELIAEGKGGLMISCPSRSSPEEKEDIKRAYRQLKARGKKKDARLIEEGEIVAKKVSTGLIGQSGRIIAYLDLVVTCMSIVGLSLLRESALRAIMRLQIPTGLQKDICL